MNCPGEERRNEPLCMAKFESEKRCEPSKPRRARVQILPGPPSFRFLNGILSQIQLFRDAPELATRYQPGEEVNWLGEPLSCTLAEPTTFGLGKGRIESLSDGIFATVMTVLVLSLSIPTIIGSTDSAITSYVLGLGPTVLSYVMSFLILALFWVRHHNIFHFISRINNTLIWLNMLFLLSVGFVPF